MRILLPALLSLVLPLNTAFADEGEDYQEQHYQYDDSGQEEQAAPEAATPEQAPDDAVTEEPAYQDPELAAHQQEARAMCQEYAADAPPEQQADYIDDCMRSQGY